MPAVRDNACSCIALHQLQWVPSVFFSLRAILSFVCPQNICREHISFLNHAENTQQKYTSCQKEKQQGRKSFTKHLLLTWFTPGSGHGFMELKIRCFCETPDTKVSAPACHSCLPLEQMDGLHTCRMSVVWWRVFRSTVSVFDRLQD